MNASAGFLGGRRRRLRPGSVETIFRGYISNQYPSSNRGVHLLKTVESFEDWRGGRLKGTMGKKEGERVLAIEIMLSDYVGQSL